MPETRLSLRGKRGAIPGRGRNRGLEKLKVGHMWGGVEEAAVGALVFSLMPRPVGSGRTTRQAPGHSHAFTTSVLDSSCGPQRALWEGARVERAGWAHSGSCKCLPQSGSVGPRRSSVCRAPSESASCGGPDGEICL